MSNTSFPFLFDMNYENMRSATSFCFCSSCQMGLRSIYPIIIWP